MKLFAGVTASLVLLLGATGEDHVTQFHDAGNVVTYEFSDHRSSDQLVYAHILVIKKVSEANGLHTVDGVLGFTEDDGEYAPMWFMKYGYDSLNFYVYASNWVYPNIPENKADRMITGGDSLVYPYDMHVGDTLSEATGTKTSITGRYDYKSEVRVTKRCVKKLDTLSLAFGEVVAFKIECSTENISYSKSGTSSETRKVTEWFSPTYGIVRHIYNLSGGFIMTTLAKPAK